MIHNIIILFIPFSRSSVEIRSIAVLPRANVLKGKETKILVSYQTKLSNGFQNKKINRRYISNHIFEAPPIPPLILIANCLNIAAILYLLRWSDQHVSGCLVCLEVSSYLRYCLGVVPVVFTLFVLYILILIYNKLFVSFRF